MNTWKRFLAMCLCLVMLMSAVGCGKESGGNDNRQTKDYVYTAEFKTLDGVESLGTSAIQGSKLYYVEWRYDEATETSDSALNVLDLNTMERSTVPVKLAENENINLISADADGNVIMLTNQYNDNSDEYFLVKLDAAGTEQMRQEITALLNSGGSSEIISYPQAMEIDGEGNIYLLSGGMSETILVLDGQGQKMYEITDMSWGAGMGKTSDGRIFLLSQDLNSSANGYMLQQIDPKTRALGDALTGIPAGSGNVSCTAGAENEILISSGNSLYRYDMTKKSCEELLNWLDMDINSDQIQKFAQLEDGRILALTYNFELEDGGAEAVYLTKTPASEVKQKTVLTYATMYLDYNVRAQIIRFNKTNDSYRIEVKEYGNGDYEAGLAQLNSDIASGNPPDLIDLNNLNVENYIAKGILTDLYPLMEADPSVKKEDLVANPLTIYERNGKLYGIAPAFGVVSLMGKVSDLGEREGWTVADVKQLISGRPEGTELIEYASRETMLEMLVRMGANSYIDWENGTCSFDSPEFIETLEFAAGFPTQENISYDSQDGTYTKISQGRLLLNELFVSSVNDYQFSAAMFGEPVTCIGYPTPDGSSGSYLMGSMSVGIAEKSAYKEGAWAFVASLLGEEFQNSLNWYLPIRESSLQKILADAMNKDNAGSFSMAMSDDFTFESRPATEEEIDSMRHLIDTAKGGRTVNNEILSIITEEAASYFAGQKTAKEAADIIQSRVQIYVSENQ